MKILPILAACLILSPSAFARIGETLEQCTARYGSPPKVGLYGPAAFRKNGLMVEIKFRDNKAVELHIFNFQKLSDIVIDGLLKANSGRSEWKLVPMPIKTFEKCWQTEDGKLYAYLIMAKGLLGGTFPLLKIGTVAELDASEKEEEAKEKNKVKGM